MALRPGLSPGLPLGGHHPISRHSRASGRLPRGEPEDAVVAVPGVASAVGVGGGDPQRAVRRDHRRPQPAVASSQFGSGLAGGRSVERDGPEALPAQGRDVGGVAGDGHA